MNEKDLTSIEEVIDMLIENSLINVHVALPAIVDKNNGDGTVNVILTVKKVKEDKEEFEIPPLNFVPIAYQGSNSFHISFPVESGDEGIAIFCERDISQFIKTSKISPPQILRKHSLSDAIFIPSLLSSPNRNIHTESNSIVLEADTTSININKNGSVKVTGDLLVTGEVTGKCDVPAASVSLTTHSHPTAAIGSPSPPTPGT